MRKLLVHIKVWYLAFKWVGKITLGSKVKHNDKIYTVSNGVSKPYWSLFIAEPHEYIEYVHQNDFRLIQSPSEWYRAFRSGLSFYYGYWFSIWVNESR
jgi:hypothetical protein